MCGMCRAIGFSSGAEGKVRFAARVASRPRTPAEPGVRLAAPPSSTFYHSRYSNQNTRADKCHNYGTYHSATGAQPKQTKYPATYESTENSQNNVSDNSVAAALHH